MDEFSIQVVLYKKLRCQNKKIYHSNIYLLRTSSLPGAIMVSHREDENHHFLLLGFIITIIILCHEPRYFSVGYEGWITYASRFFFSLIQKKKNSYKDFALSEMIEVFYGLSCMLVTHLNICFQKLVLEIFKHRRMIAAPTPGLIVRQFRLFINLKMLQWFYPDFYIIIICQLSP